MSGITFEIVINFIQQIVFIGFLFLFFDKPQNKAKNILGFVLTVLSLFAMATYFTYHEMTLNHLDSIITLTVMVLYSLLFLKGSIYLRIIIPISAFALNLLVAYGNALLLTSLGNRPFEDAIAFSTSFRNIYLIIGNAVYAGLLTIMLLTGKKKIRLNNTYDIISVTIIPTIVYIALISTLLLFEAIEFNNSVLVYIIIIIASLAIIAVLFWILLFRISNAGKAQTELLLVSQREKLYKESVLQTNEKIEEISIIKHDTSNMLSTLESLMMNGEYTKALDLCTNMSNKLKQTQTPFHTNNPVLNAILNVEMEKAVQTNIEFTAEISDTLLFAKDSDIVSVIGNLIDNAIEYIENKPSVSRIITLKIFDHNDYCYITCSNPIDCSVLKHNPNFITSKNDLLLHGKGIKTMRNIAEQYEGNMMVQESKNEIQISVILKNTLKE